MELKRYELVFEDSEDGVFCLSPVMNPATKTQLVKFDDELMLMEFKDDSKRVIYSVAMRPGMLIPRKNINGEAAEVFYSEETVRALQQNFFRQNFHNGATVNHDKNKRDGIYAFESWIVEDPEKDKASTLGLKVQKGDWIVAQKVDDPETWEKIESGEITGTSIEAMLQPVLVTDNKVEMTQEEVDARIKVILMESEEEKKKAEAEAAAAVEEEMATETTTEETTEETTEDTPSVEELQKRVEELETENNDLKAKISEYEASKVEMSAEIAAAKKVAVEMGEEIAKGIKPVGTPAKEFHEMSNYERLLHNKNKR